jgi:ABC-type Mn2+/Zn2+ transport system permease subunit
MSALYLPQMFTSESDGISFQSMIGCIAALIGTGAVCRSIDYESTGLKHAAWILHCATVGAILAPLCVLGGPVLMRAAWYTLGVVGGTFRHCSYFQYPVVPLQG